MRSPPWWRCKLDGYGGQDSLGGESVEGAIGSYLFVCCATGSTDGRLYASHEQFPIALFHFLCRVEAEHFRCSVIYVDTHSVNLSAEAEEVCALFKTIIVPVSGGTPHCTAHGGGKRCQEEGCCKSARGDTGACTAHGGGRRCQHEGCPKAAATGGTLN